MSAPSQVYPFSTRTGDAIPADIIKPTGLLVKEFLISAVTPIILPAKVLTGAVIATESCILVFGGGAPTIPPVDGSVIENGLYIPKDFVISTTLEPGTAYIISLGKTGIIYIQMVEKWASLALEQQFKVK